MPAEYTAQGKIKKAKPDGAGGFVSDLPLSAPGAPSFTVSKTSSSITANITDASGATSYESSVDGTNWVPGRAVTGLTPETFYLFQIVGINSVGTGPAASKSVTTNAATGSPSISTVTDNGDGTISITGSNFGAKAQAAPLLHDIGGNAWENGVLNTFYADQVDGTEPSKDLTYPNANAPYVTFSADTDTATFGPAIAKIDKTSPVRHAAQGCNYFFTGGKARIGEPTVYRSGTGTERKLYWAAWQKYKYQWTIFPLRTDAVNNGPLIFEEGVTINGQSVAGAKYLGFFSGKSFHYVYIPDQGLNPVSSGDVIAGVTSGASFTVTSKFIPGGKIGRMRSDYNQDEVIRDRLIASDSDDSFYISPINSNQLFEKSIVADEQAGGAWCLIEYEVEYFPGTQTCVWRNWWNGRSRGELIADVSTRGDIYGITISLWGLDNSDRARPQELIVSETYMDNVFNRVYLADASTWSAVTHRELQRPTAWSDTAITVSKNDGTLAATKWAYVVGPDGSVNENGVQV